jgi:hypothetical protein
VNCVALGGVAPGIEFGRATDHFLCAENLAFLFNYLPVSKPAYPQTSPQSLWKKFPKMGNKVMHRLINIPSDAKKIFPI